MLTGRVQPRLGTSLPATRTVLTTSRIQPRHRPRPSVAQTRNVAAVPGKDPDNMGGPGGQEHFPESNSLRRRYTMTTMIGVLAACSVMAAAKISRLNKDMNANYILVHDSSKGELDDVKFIKRSDLPKS